MCMLSIVVAQEENNPFFAWYVKFKNENLHIYSDYNYIKAIYKQITKRNWNSQRKT